MPARCLAHVDKIVKLPESQWKEQIMALPTKCPHTDCGREKCCQKIVREYLLVQAKARRFRARLKEGLVVTQRRANWKARG